MYKAIIFDFFGVMVSDMYIDWINKNNLGHLIPDLKENYFKRSDKGEISTFELHSHFANLVNRPLLQVETELKSFLIINNELVDFIKTIKPKIKIALCSNAPTDFVEDFLKESNLDVLFDEVVISSKLGTRKPDTAIFDKTAELLGVDAKDTVFVDDTLENIESASLLGIKSILFTDFKSFERDLFGFTLY
jgi:HAD superfamily hydrolase (TIGR01509 family)